MTVSYGRGTKGKATKLHAELVRARGDCERCHGEHCGNEYLQCAHIVRRGPNWTRTDLENAWCLGARCHRLVDDWADEKMLLVDRTIGVGRYESLKRKANEGVRVKFDWDVELERLRRIRDAVPDGV